MLSQAIPLNSLTTAGQELGISIFVYELLHDVFYWEYKAIVIT